MTDNSPSLEDRVRTLEAKVTLQKAELEAANLAICSLLGDHAQRFKLTEEQALERFEAVFSLLMNIETDLHPAEADIANDGIQHAFKRLIQNMRNSVRLNRRK